MKLSSSLLLVFLLVLHLLLCGAFGARIGKFAMKSTTSHQLPSLENENDVKKDDDQSRLDNYNLSGAKQQIIDHVKCNDNEDDCSSSKGKNRKLITSTTMSTSTAKPIQENLDYTKRDEKTQRISSSSSKLNHHGVPSTEFEVDKHKKALPKVEFENVMDMTVMDYSPAKRKPPIHN